MNMEIIWQSTITEEMVRSLNLEQISELVSMLDKVVADLSEEYGVE